MLSEESTSENGAALPRPCYAGTVMSLTIRLNGQLRTFDALVASSTVDLLLADLKLQGDRIAVEHNGTIVSRAKWSDTPLEEGDQLEVVHFVGGGKEEPSPGDIKSWSNASHRSP